MLRRSSSLLVELVHWWLLRFTCQAKQSVVQWAREPEWPLLATSSIFFLSFVLHWLGYQLAVHRIGWNAPLFAPTQWEGRTGWRKPMIFGISNAMLFISLRIALCAQQRVPRALTSHVAAWSTLVEVAIITLQAWRDVPSHFNTTTELDATLYGVKILGALILSGACVAATFGVLSNARLNASTCRSVALRHGLLLICFAAAVGLAQALYGHLPRLAQAVENEPCRSATAGVAASPCYEVYGQAIVKLAHFLPLHATEVLLALAWALDQTRQSQARSLGQMQIAAVACWGLALLGIYVTAMGINLKEPPLVVACVLFGLLASVFLMFLITFCVPLAKGIKDQCD